MGIQFEGIGDVYMFILAVLLGELGKHLDDHPMGGYSCPIYCAVDHKHTIKEREEIMPKRTYKVLRFDGGLNEQADSKDIGDNQLSRANNCAIERIGKLRVLGDFDTEYKTLAGAITNPGTGFFAVSSDQKGLLDGTPGYIEGGRVYWLVENDEKISGIESAAEEDPAFLTSSGLESAVMYYVDGVLRIGDADHTSSSNTMWRGFINARRLMPGVAITSGYGGSEQDSAWYYDTASIDGAFPVFAPDSSPLVERCRNALCLNDEDVTAYGFRFDNGTVDTYDDGWTGVGASGNSGMLWGFALTFDESDAGSGSGTWMPRITTRYKFYVTTMYDDHTQESLPQLMRMFGSRLSLDGNSLVGDDVEDEIYFTNGDTNEEGENVAVGFAPWVKIIGDTFNVYNFGADDESDGDAGNRRISGIRIYWASNEDGYTTLWQMFDAKFDEGCKAIGVDGGGGGTSGYSPWIDDGDGAVDSTVTIGLGETDVWTNPPRYFQYDVLNGHSSTDTINVDSFKTAVVANRRVYIGNVTQDGWIHGDRMLKSPVNQFDKFPSINNIDVAINDGDEIVALIEYADRILQFKKNAVYIINVSSNTEYLESEHRFKGISNPGAACRTDYGCAWVNQNGCYMYNGEQVTDLLEDQGQRKIPAETWFNFISTNKGERIGFDPKTRQLIVKGNTTDSFVYDMVTKSWVKGISNMPDTKSNFINDPIDGSLLVWSGGKIYKWGGATTAKAKFEIRTKFFDFGEPTQRRKISKIYITHRYAGDGDKIGFYGEIIGGKSTSGQGPGEVSNDFFLGYLQEDDPYPENWITQEFTMPSLDLADPQNTIKFNNVYAMRLYINTEGETWYKAGIPGGSDFVGEAGAYFEVNDITIVYRDKSVK